MSVLEEPPMDRMPIQTYVMEYDEETGQGSYQQGTAQEAARFIMFITG